MKRYLLLVLVVLFLNTVAFAEVPWHKNQLAFISINGKTFINYLFDNASIFGYSKELASEFAASFLANSGSDLMKDFQNIGVLVYMGNDNKMHALGFLSGKFKPDKWYNELHTITSKTKVGLMASSSIRNSGNNKILDFVSRKKNTSGANRVFSICLQSKKVLFGTNTEVDYALKNLSDAPAGVVKQIKKQTYFAYLNMNIVNEKFAKDPRLAAIATIIQPLSRVYIFLTGGRFLIRVVCKNDEMAKNFEAMVRSMISGNQQKLANALKALKEPSSGPGWLLNSLAYFHTKGSLLSTKDVIDLILIARKTNVVMMKAVIPPVYKTAFVLGVIRGVAALATTKFRKAKNLAYTKACYANQRVLLGGVELYNMDHSKMIKSFGSDTMEKLVKGKYIRHPIVCPEGGTYSSSGDLSTADGAIKCSKHGPVPTK